MECCKRVGVEGGKLQLDSFGIELEIPPGAIDSEVPQDISLRVLTDTPILGNSKKEMSACFGVQCLAPDDLVLKLPVTYTIPHCAVITQYPRVEAVLYTGEGEYSPDIVEEQGQRIPYSLFLEEFATLLDSFVLDPSEVVLTGDFNVWVDDFNDVRARQFMNILSSYGMKQLVREGTHLHGHTLDLLITRDSATLVSDVSVILGVSDHHAVQCNLDLRKPSTSRRTVTTRPLRSMNREQFRSGVHESLSEIDIEDSSISSSVERYDLSLTSLLDKLAPQKTRSVIIKPSSPWMTEKIHAAKCLRRRLERKWRRTRSEEDCKSYVTQRQVVSQEIEKAKTEYYSECVAECEGNQRRLFTVVDALLHRKKETVLPGASSDQILADNFCHYFFNKVTKIRDDIDVELSSGQCVQHDESSSVPVLTDFAKTSISEIKRVVMNSPTSSSSMQRTLVKPLLKKPNLDRQDFASYRPVANLSFLSKVIERIVSARLQSFLNDNNLQDNFQSAYREKHSVETALLRVQNDIHTEMDSGKVTGRILLDLSSAFDTVDHVILLERLQFMGIGGQAHQWLTSYLSNRSQRVCVRSAVSKTVHLGFSVPQGSVLGPQLFNIYTLPLHDIIKRHNLKHHMYADDTQIYFSCSPTQGEVDAWIARIEACISDIRNWMKEIYLKLNDDKSQFVMLGSKQQLAKSVTPYLNIGSSSITPVKKVRNLGVIFYSNMTMGSQV
ncbi:uncharacterized protein LOC763238 [Strongylocentrotus purpuratus]|uniref:Reverse transcriptase domain-containing protein n=1 Tax=Strongylocentrotus purpuratus TaxID=7668 RepID=A0A7M7GG38_STRPU|nr:uncharacterized protein LOC763238 [Strongylocentrotus purpuratus]|eukprot:XP_003724061.1 PREDICTED: uncharacterized protein LOC763238 [Strongylocentrotus purpuratus]